MAWSDLTDVLPSVVTAATAVIAIYLTNKHNLKVAREDRQETRTQLLDDRKWDREERAAMQQANADGLKAEQKREAIVAAIRSCGDLTGTLVVAKAAIESGVTGARLELPVLSELSTNLYRVLLEVPSEKLREEVGFTLRAAETAARSVRAGQSGGMRDVDDAIGQLSEMTKKLIEVHSGHVLPEDWDQDVPGTNAPNT